MYVPFRFVRTALFTMAATFAVPTLAHAQHGHHHTMMQQMAHDTSMLTLPMTRMGSGTSWLPDAAPMHAHHAMAGAWSLMLHYAVFGYYDKQGGRRGDDQFGSINWAMVMGSRRLAGGQLMLRGMVSAEALTVTHTTGRTQRTFHLA
jgi:hypothetical protein